jgi:chemotaxis protein methyltransferase CheR
MKTSLPEILLSRLSEIISARTALHFPKEQWENLERKVVSAAKELNFKDPESFVSWLVSSPPTTEQMDILLSHLTIHETYFWREPQVFEALEEQILPEIIRTQRGCEKRLRIWSAGCATGEEPYSLAIALNRVIPDMKNWHITILATDINPGILRKAAAGVYGQWSFRNAPLWLKEKYFCCNDRGKYELIPEIREMVTFAYLNLAEDIYPSPLNNTNAMDIIFCRNVMMYFAPERSMKISRKLFNALVDSGWLVVGASELSYETFTSFTPVHFPGAIAYRKEGMGTRPHVPSTLDDVEKILPVLESSDIRAEQKTWPSWYKESETNQISDILPAQPVEQKYVSDASAIAHKDEASEEKEKKEAVANISLAARLLANQGKLDEAFGLCEKAIVSDKLNPGLYFLRAVILQELGRIDEAAVALKRTLYLDPDFVLAHYSLGNLMLRRGNAKAAKKSFENVLALLNAFREDDVLPESEGLTAGRFKEIICATIQTGSAT